MQAPGQTRGAAWLAEIAAIAAAYAVSGGLGQFAALPPGHVTPIWPASGIALMAVLARGGAIWPGIWLGSFAVNLWASLHGGAGVAGVRFVLAAAAIATGATLQALAGASLVRRTAGDEPLRSARTVLWFILHGALLSCLINATVGTSALTLAGLNRWAAYATTWWTWWLGDSSGVLVVTPLLLSWWSRPAEALPGRGAEVAALSASVLLVGALAFWGRYPVAYLVIPLPVWAAFRFGQRGATLAIVVLAAIAIAGAVRGVGPFVSNGLSLNESLLLLQGFMGVSVVTSLLLAAVVGERERVAAELRQYRDRLEEQVRQRTHQLEETNVRLDEANQALRQLSMLDGLTGIANRRRFDEQLEVEWRRALRVAGKLSLILIDIDFFKRYNDAYGHPRGDRCLIEVTSCIRENVARAGEMVARYGGEEFAVLVPSTDSTGACVLAERLRARVEALGIPHEDSPCRPVVTISLGVASASPREGGGPAELLTRADEALYRAKRGGRNQVQMADTVSA